MRAIAITAVLLLVAWVYLDPTSNGIESLTEAVFWAGLGIWGVVLAIPKRRGRSFMWTAIAVHIINRKKRNRHEVFETNRRSSGRAHRDQSATHQGRPVQRRTASRANPARPTDPT